MNNYKFQLIKGMTKHLRWQIRIHISIKREV